MTPAQVEEILPSQAPTYIYQQQTKGYISHNSITEVKENEEYLPKI